MSHNYIAIQLRAEQHGLMRLLNLGLLTASEYRRNYTRIESQLELIGGAA